MGPGSVLLVHAGLGRAGRCVSGCPWPCRGLSHAAADVAVMVLQSQQLNKPGAPAGKTASSVSGLVDMCRAMSQRLLGCCGKRALHT